MNRFNVLMDRTEAYQKQGWRWAWFWKNNFLHHSNQRCIWNKRLVFLIFRGSLLWYVDYSLSLWSERISSCLVWKIDYSCTAAILAWKGVSLITLSSIVMSLHDYLVVYVDYIVIRGVQWYNSLEIFLRSPRSSLIHEFQKRKVERILLFQN